MTTPQDQSRHAFELHQQGLSLEQIAERLNTSDDRASQLIAAYQRQQPAEPELPWWHGLSHSNRLFLEDLEFHSRAEVEQAYQEGAFTHGHPNCLTGLSKHRRQRIIAWLEQSREPADIPYPTVETVTLRIDTEHVRELDALANAAKVEPSEIVALLIRREAERQKIKRTS